MTDWTPEENPRLTQAEVDEWWERAGTLAYPGAEDGFLRLEGGTLDVGIFYWRPPRWKRWLLPWVRRRDRQEQAVRAAFMANCLDDAERMGRTE